MSAAYLEEAGVPLLPSAKEALILRLLVARGEIYGLQFVEESGGALKSGTVYTTLERMVAKGFVASRVAPKDPHASGRPRRLWRATEGGAHALSVRDAAVAALTSSTQFHKGGTP